MAYYPTYGYVTIYALAPYFFEMMLMMFIILLPLLLLPKIVTAFEKVTG
jgi:competence protein ComGC